MKDKKNKNTPSKHFQNIMGNRGNRDKIDTAGINLLYWYN
jgi:hypothetical protein